MRRKIGMVVMVVVMCAVLATAALADDRPTSGYFAQMVTDKKTTVEAGNSALEQMCDDDLLQKAKPLSRADFEKASTPLAPVKIDKRGRTLADVTALDGDVLQRVGETANLDFAVSAIYDVRCRTVRQFGGAFREASAVTTVTVRDIRKGITYTWTSEPKNPPKFNAKDNYPWDSAPPLFTIPLAPLILPHNQFSPVGEDDKLEQAVVHKATVMAAKSLERQIMPWRALISANPSE